MRLYHYTCSHAAPGIERERWLRPNAQIQFPTFQPFLVWLTDLDRPDVFGLGLTSYSLRCDRAEFQAIVSTIDAVHWPKYAKQWPRKTRAIVEDCPGALPMHWWVSEAPVPILSIGPVV